MDEHTLEMEAWEREEMQKRLEDLESDRLILISLVRYLVYKEDENSYGPSCYGYDKGNMSEEHLVMLGFIFNE